MLGKVLCKQIEEFEGVHFMQVVSYIRVVFERAPDTLSPFSVRPVAKADIELVYPKAQWQQVTSVEGKTLFIVGETYDFNL